MEKKVPAKIKKWRNVRATWQSETSALVKTYQMCMGDYSK